MSGHTRAPRGVGRGSREGDGPWARGCAMLRRVAGGTRAGPGGRPIVYLGGQLLMGHLARWLTRAPIPIRAPPTTTNSGARKIGQVSVTRRRVQRHV